MLVWKALIAFTGWARYTGYLITALKNAISLLMGTLLHNDTCIILSLLLFYGVSTAHTS